MKGLKLLTLLILIICLCGCNTKMLTAEQSKKNFNLYESSLNKIASNFNMSLNEIPNPEGQYDGYKVVWRDFEINIDENQKIAINVSNYASESGKGTEFFCIKYSIENFKDNAEYNLPLFVELVNDLAGRTLTVDFCEEFLNAPEDKYSAEGYGHEKTDDEVIAKRKPFGFFDDWHIYYTLTKDGTSTFKYCGLTKMSSS